MCYEKRDPEQARVCFERDQRKGAYIEREALLRHIDIHCDGCGEARHCVVTAPAADVAPVVHGPMRVEVTTDDFVNRELASNSGWYRKRYFCPSCGQKLKEETYEKEHCFASWDLVREECPLHHCPNCGAHMKDGEG